MSASGRTRRVTPGDEVETYCGKCKLERTHQVVALNAGGGVERVVCRFCQSNHLYRERRSSTGASSPSISRGRANHAEAARPAQTVAVPLRPYSSKESYAEGDMIEHPKFGQGRVVEARAGKIGVKFGPEVRTLLHAG